MGIWTIILILIVVFGCSDVRPYIRSDNLKLDKAERIEVGMKGKFNGCKSGGKKGGRREKREVKPFLPNKNSSLNTIAAMALTQQGRPDISLIEPTPLLAIC